MANRKFRLPDVDDLNKDQRRVYRQEEEGQYLIIGGPGTGKSVVALLRVLKQTSNNYKFLTYNKVLLSATRQMIRRDINSLTLDSFFGKIYWHKYKEFTPKIENSNKSHKPLDYDKIISQLEEKDIFPNSEKIIIDEGQDKPPEFYEALINFGYENFFIVADQNQQITDENSTREELINTMGLDERDVIKLHENYRNSRHISLCAQHFYTDPSSPRPELPSEERPSLGIPVLYEYTDYNRCIELILREADKDTSFLVGVIVARNLEAWNNRIKAVNIPLDNPKPVISTYSSDSSQGVNIDFTSGGIVVLNDKSVKGTEFDIVFIIIDDFNIYNNDIESMKKRFYVMSSRAMKKLVFLKHKNYNGGVESILPQDPNILKREELTNG